MSAVALVGRPNVGKSTLFNRLTGSRHALVANLPGLTRDRQYGRAELDDHVVSVIDTGGLLGDDDEVTKLMAEQVEIAIGEADLVLMLVDARDGLTPADQEIALQLRRRGAAVLLVVNKIDGVSELALGEFSALGFADMHAISATHGRGMGELRESLSERTAPEPDTAVTKGIRVAIVGRPNVGKSTLVNRIVGEERQVVFDLPGTTRDSIDVAMTRDGLDYVLIDTAGVRRKGKVTDTVEKFSVVKTLDALERAEVAIVLTDAREGLVDQDLHLVSYAIEAGAGVLLVINKWDGLTASERDAARSSVERKMRFAPWVPIRFVSALHGSGVGNLFADIDKIFEAGLFDVQTADLNRILARALEEHPPPAVRGRAIKLRYVNKTGSHPPSLLLHGNQTDKLPAGYLRYLENYYRDALQLVGVPIRVECRTSANPFAGKRNELTRRQRVRRKRVIRHRRR